MILKDKKYRLPREWSNRELRKFSHLFEGEIINVSGWTDVDKEGGYYKQYFKNCSTYTISNYLTDSKGYQERDNEIFINLEEQLNSDFIRRFDVVFNHTTLEHIFNFRKAFQNLCNMTKDIVILIVPFLQQIHGEGYKDFWRFSPEALNYLFKENGFEIIYLNFNNNKRSSVYIFTIASKNPERWKSKINSPSIKNKKIWLDPYITGIGSRAIINNLLFRIKMKIKSLFIKDLYY